MSNLNELTVYVFGHQITAVLDEDGSLYVPLKRLCEILGIDHKWQTKKVKTYGIYDEKVLPVLSTNGRYRRMLCLPVKRMYSWTRDVNHNKVRPDMVQRLFEYRDESHAAMTHFVNHGMWLSTSVR